ncbi:MAG: hypothetical protein U1E05_04995, partial [Patescibacteria group bacterium]|nr:hypothetical protein [Patescibacteria group bacterium]
MGRAKFKDSVKLRDSLIETQVKSGLLEVGMYDPTAMADDVAAIELQQRWKVHAGETMPSWFDFPYNRKMRTLREASAGSDTRPRHETVWYIDDDHNVVYVRGGWG